MRGVWEFANHTSIAAGTTKVSGTIVAEPHPEGLKHVVALDVRVSALGLGGMVEVVVSLEPAVWRRGYATEALRAVIAYAFTSLKLARLAAVQDHLGNRANKKELSSWKEANDELSVCAQRITCQLDNARELPGNRKDCTTIVAPAEPPKKQ